MNQLLLATRNPGKFVEMRDILSDLPFHFYSLTECGIAKDIEETGQTFEENAKQKAIAYGTLAQMLTIADDSGLCIDALSGRPGIHSARYVKGTDADRIKKILEELATVPSEKRTAHFIAFVALFDPKTKQTEVFSGRSDGYITQGPKGIHGFGYDPIFFNNDLGKTNGEATGKEKNTVSHRARALLACRNALIQRFKA